MVNQNLKLTIIHNNDGTFEDLSFYAYDFSKDSFDLQLLTTSYLYVGYYKPINSLYFAINTANTNSNTFTIEYYNGSSWDELEATDDTVGLTRSGFINWDRNLTNDSLTSVDSKSKYWIRIKTSANHSATTNLQAINFVFCDDNDLKYEVPEITDINHLAGKTSHILTHVAVRNEIIQTLNNKDLKHVNQTTGLKEDLTCWDILDANQLKQACVYLALAKI
ncbi:MAG: hypothetical protein KDD45_12135, partial [Bdellovibrionales bacterium]|nr:hypothetical protein [Bdellovibrionales bacterium]